MGLTVTSTSIYASFIQFSAHYYPLAAISSFLEFLDEEGAHWRLLLSPRTLMILRLPPESFIDIHPVCDLDLLRPP